MSLDWLPIEHATWDKPATLRIAARLGLKVPHVVGLLATAWRWHDQHGRGELVAGASAEDLDLAVGHTGFAAAMSDAGWVRFDADGARFPRSLADRIWTAKERAEGGHLRSEKRQNAKVGQVANWLGHIANRGNLVATWVLEEGSKLGFSPRTIYRAKKELGILSWQSEGRWFWGFCANNGDSDCQTDGQVARLPSQVVRLPVQEQEQEQALLACLHPSVSYTCDHSEKDAASQPEGVASSGPVLAVPAKPDRPIEVDQRRILRTLQLVHGSPISQKFRARALVAVKSIAESGRDPLPIVSDLQRRSAVAGNPGAWILRALEDEAAAKP